MQVRAARTADIPALAHLNEAVQGLHAAAHPALFKVAPDAAAITGWFGDFLAKSGAHLLIGEEAGAPVGYIAGEVVRYPDNPFRHSYVLGLVDQLTIAAEVQRRGYGERLLDALLVRFRIAGVGRVELSVWAFNTGARQFYERQGFTTFNYRMSLDLAPALTAHG
jgi:ribosomal protein S18 acetylase RimI-like enzyme